MMVDEGILSHPERRHYHRLKIALDVTVQVGEQRVPSTTANISCGGLYLPHLAAELSPSSALEITLALPCQAKPVKVHGQIARQVPARLMDTELMGVAIEFLGLYDDHRLAIDQFIKEKIH